MKKDSYLFRAAHFLNGMHARLPSDQQDTHCTYLMPAEIILVCFLLKTKPSQADLTKLNDVTQACSSCLFTG